MKDSYKSLNEALTHGGIENSTNVEIKWINSEKLNKKNINEQLKKCNGILVPGGFGLRGIVGKIEAIRYARENDIPFFGICLGMQLAIIEIARKVLKIRDANSTEFTKTKNPVVGLMTEWTKDSKIITRNIDSDKGGTMRLGAYQCMLQKNTLAKRIYKSDSILERHRHRYEVNTNYIQRFNKNGFIFSGMSPDNLLPEILESVNHKWFLGVQFHPEFKSRPQQPHPLFVSFVEAAIKEKYEKN